MTAGVESAVTFFIQMVIIVDPVVVMPVLLALLAVQYVITGSVAIRGG